MTLLEEYQALPREPAKVSFGTKQNALLTTIAALRRKVDRRDAVIRLLCRALREARPCVHYTAMDMGLDGECSALLADVDALLTAVERDFPENSNG